MKYVRKVKILSMNVNTTKSCYINGLLEYEIF